MASTSETGHAVNVSNFKLLKEKCTGFGASYHPSNPDITIAALTAKWQASGAAESTVSQVLQQCKNPINNRQLLFAPVPKLVTRILNAVKSSKASKAFVQDVKTLADRYRGLSKAPAKAKAADAAPTTEPATGSSADSKDTAKAISTSHLGYVQRANSFNQLVALLATETNYTPNEPELTLASLQALGANMKQLNDDIGAIIAPLENGRIARNRELYAPETGLVDIANTCKAYVVSVFGAGSPESKMLTKIKFRDRKL